MTEKEKIIKDCWSRDFDYENYLSYTKQAEVPAVGKKVYENIYNELQKNYIKHNE